MRLLSQEALASRVCYACGSNKTRMRYREKIVPHPEWILNHDESNNILCKDCYLKYIYAPEWERRNRKGKRIQYAKKLVYLKWLQRTGICSACKKSVHKGEIPKTSMDHEHYIVIFPWFSIKEYCYSCHIKIGLKRGQVIPKRAAFIRDLRKTIGPNSFCIVPHSHSITYVR